VFPNTVYNQAAGQVAMHLGLHGPTSTLSAGHATAGVTLGYAADLLRASRADLLVATVTDTVSPAVARAYAENGTISLRPDGAPSDGRVALADGSVSIVMERRSAAVARGATVLGQLAGCGMASDGSPSGRWDPRGRGLERAMREALRYATLTAGDVGSVWMAAAGLSAADRAEEAALARLFGSRDIRRHAPKLLLGDPIGAGAALSLALAVRSLSAGERAPALINSSSLTGSHACLVLRP
jgi:3-oxoacyl-[acyl-carrier-protein] synthase II